MDGAAIPLDFSDAPLDVLTLVFETVSLNDRFTCALVCKAWAVAASAATRSILLEPARNISCLQSWLEQHGYQLEVLQLHECRRGSSLTGLPCPQLQDLLLHGSLARGLIIGSRVWDAIAAATKLTSVSLSHVCTAAQQVSAVTALPDLAQLTWHHVGCYDQQRLSDNLLLQKYPELRDDPEVTAVEAPLTAKALEHPGLLAKLQDVSISAAGDRAAANCPGLQELKGLTRLELLHGFDDIPACVSQLTALQQLEVCDATLAAVYGLQALTGLTQLRVQQLAGVTDESAPLQLPSLQHLELEVSTKCLFIDDGWMQDSMPLSFLASCTQLRVLELRLFSFTGTGSLVVSTMLQSLVLDGCGTAMIDGPADSDQWQHVIPGPGQLPHFTTLSLREMHPDPQQPDIERVVACCGSLQVLQLNKLGHGFAPALARLTGLTSLYLDVATDRECEVLPQLAGLRELTVGFAEDVSIIGLRRLAALEELTGLYFPWALKPSNINPMLHQLMAGRVPTYDHAIINTAPAGHPPDVSAQLLRALTMDGASDS